MGVAGCNPAGAPRLPGPGTGGTGWVASGMAIPPEDVARVREAVDLVAVASEHMALKRVGQRWVGLCPFHAEKTPSFSVNAEQGLYYCFGCGAGGDAITFVRELEHLDFGEAVERLAHRAGITVRTDDRPSTGDRRRRDAVAEVIARAVAWYHERLLVAPDAASARAYLRGRGYDAEVVRRYELGWAPEGWDALVRALGVPERVALEAGLGFVNARGRLQDAFRGRILFPIHDVRGAPVAFGGRILPGGRGPKYRNSAETALYRKSRVLYGLHRAKAAMVDAGEVVVCEGYTDVIGLGQAGIDRAVATCGTALGEDHLRTLAHFCPRIVLAYDADAAGRAAAERIYAWERSLAVDVAVADLPTGRDPADLAAEDPAGLRAAVEGARPLLAFRVARVWETGDLGTVESRARAAERALEVVAEHPSELVRDQYLMEVADRTRTDVDRLRAHLAGGSGRAARRGSATSPAGLAPRVSLTGPEESVLVVAVHRPQQLVGRITGELFAPGPGRAAYQALARARTLAEAIDGAEPPVAATLRRLAVVPDEVDVDEALALLAREATKRALDQLQATWRQAPEPRDYAELNQFLATIAQDLADPSSALARSATDRLVGWLDGELGDLGEPHEDGP